MKMRKGITPKLNETLDELKAVPARDPEAAARGKARFLAEAASLQAARERSSRPRPVATRRLALNTVMLVALVLALFFGSVGAALAAQSALPGEALYPLKIWTEDARLNFVSNPDAGIDLLMQFVQTRVNEMNELAAQGVTPPAETQERIEQHVRTALELAAGMDDDAMQAALLRIRAQLEAQSQSLADGTSEQVRMMLQAQLQRVDEGLADPAAFRNAIRNQEQAGETATQVPGQQATPTPGATTTGDGAGGTPTPGGGGQSPTTGPNNPQVTPGPTQEPGGNGNGNGNGGGQGGKP